MKIENWQDLQPHPLANLVPRMTPTQQSALNKDIKDKGLRFPIVVVSDGNGGYLILDGRNRHEACVVEQVEPNFWEYPSDDLSGFVISTLQRKDLTWAEKTGAIKSLLAHQPDLSSRSVAREFGVSHHTVEKLRQEIPEHDNGDDAHSANEPEFIPGEVSELGRPADPGEFKVKEIAVERIEASGKRARGRQPDTPEQKAAKQAAREAAKANGERKPISSVREARIDFVNNWLKADLPGALSEILQLVSGYDGRILIELSAASRRQHFNKWAKIYGYDPID